MPEASYWLNLYSHKTWEEFLQAGANVAGFRASRWKTALQIKPGDFLLGYLTGVSRWISLQQATGKAFQDTTPIWKDNDFPVRVPVKVLVALTPETAVPIMELRHHLSIFQNLLNPHAWTGRLRGSPTRWNISDGKAIARALSEAQKNPLARPLDPAKLRRISPFLRTPSGDLVTIPEPETDDLTGGRMLTFAEDENNEAATHTEIQWLLAKLGNDMGLDIWIARNDRNREYNGNKFIDLPRLISRLPAQFNDATKRTIELIDVLWLRGQSIVSAFEIESTTAIYSGLLRMSDLIAMQPNLSIPLYIVAPEDRRDKVKTEITRPTFSKLSTPLSDVCRYISFRALRENVAKAGPFAKHLNPQFIDEFAEVCDTEEV